MKKLFLMLLAIALVGSFAFAEVTGVEAPSVSGSVTTTFGYNLDLEASGFSNDADVTVTVPLAGGSDSAMGSGDIYAEITVEDIEITLTSDDVHWGSDDLGVAEEQDGNLVVDASVSAKIVIGDLYVGLGNPDLTFNMTDHDADRDFNGTVEGEYGISIGYATDAFAIEFGVASMEDYLDETDAADAGDSATDWYDSYEEDAANAVTDTANTGNDYVFGVNGSVGELLSFAFAYDALTEQLGFGVTPSYAAGPFSITVPMDYVKVVDEWGFDVYPQVSFALEGVATFGVGMLYQTWDVAVLGGTGDYIEAGLTITEDMMDELTAEIGFTIEDLTENDGAMAWEATLELTYDLGMAVAYLNTGYDVDGVVPLNIGADFPTMIDMATVNVDYESDDVADFANNKGIISFGVTVEY